MKKDTNQRLHENAARPSRRLRAQKSILHVSYLNGWSKNDPLAGYKLHFEKVDRGYLTDEELDRLANKVFAMKRLEVIATSFCSVAIPVWPILTSNIYPPICSANGPTAICGSTPNVRRPMCPYTYRLLDIPIRLIEKYGGPAKGGLLFPVPSNQKVNSYLKEIASVCGIDKDLTFHMARHTFATTVTLANGVPIETVSKMLGHTNIQTTQIYARVIDTKINNDMEVLAGKLNAKAMIRPTTVAAGL